MVSVFGITCKSGTGLCKTITKQINERTKLLQTFFDTLINFFTTQVGAEIHGFSFVF